MFLSISICSWAFSAVFDDHLGPPRTPLRWPRISATSGMLLQSLDRSCGTSWNFNLISRQNVARDCGESRTEYNILGLKSSKLCCINTVIKTDRGRPTMTIVWEWLLARLASIQCTKQWSTWKSNEAYSKQWSTWKSKMCIASLLHGRYYIVKKNSSPHQSTLSKMDASFGNSSYTEIIWP